MATKARIQAKLFGVIEKTVGESTVKVNVNHDVDIALTDGDGNKQIRGSYGPIERTLAASANETIDLAGLIADHFGDTVTAAAIKAIMITGKSTNQGNLEFGPNSSNGWLGQWKAATDRTLVEPDGGFLHWSPNAGRAVTAGTGDLLYAENLDGSNSNIYEITFFFDEA